MRRALEKVHIYPSSNSGGSKGSPPAIYGPGKLQSQEVLHLKESHQRQARALQASVGIVTRVKDWSSGDPSDATRFREKIHHIQEQNMFLERLLKLRDIRQHAANIASSVSSRNPEPSPGSDSTSYLTALEEVFHKATTNPGANFVLGLKDSYRFRAEDAQRQGTYLQLTSEDWLFPVMAMSFADSPPVSGLISVPFCSDLLFAISKHRDALHRDENAVLSWHLRSNLVKEERQENHWYSLRSSLDLQEHKCRIFQHFPAHSTAKYTLLTTTLQDVRLRNEKELVGFRYHLAYSLAVFFMQAYAAKIDISSPKWLFFLEKPSIEIDPEDLVLEFKKLYLKSIDGQYRGASSGSLQLTTQDTHGTSVHKLGILLHEIGSWTPVVKTRLDKAVELAKTNAPKSRSALGLPYFNAVQACLDWQDDFRQDEFQKLVLTPLYSQKSKFVPPTNEVYGTDE